MEWWNDWMVKLWNCGMIDNAKKGTVLYRAKHQCFVLCKTGMFYNTQKTNVCFITLYFHTALYYCTWCCTVLHCTLQCILYTIQCTHLQCILYTIQCTLLYCWWNVSANLQTIKTRQTWWSSWKIELWTGSCQLPNVSFQLWNVAC